MKRSIHKIGLTALFVFILQSTWAEMRIWTDNAGKKMEAEFVRSDGSQLVLRKLDGAEIKVSINSLSERDQNYAILQTPPRIDISVSADVDRTNKGVGRNIGPGMQIQRENVSVEVKVKKSSSAPYEVPLVLDVVLLGKHEQSGGYIVLENDSTDFSFMAANKNEYVFETGEVSLKQLEAGREMGVEYEGYLAVVSDKAGNVLQIKCNKLDFQKNAEAILAAKRGRLFDAEFNPVEREPMQKKDESEKRRKFNFPGRRF